MTKMSIVEKIQEFRPETERFSTYVKRLKLYFDANSVTEEKKVPVFLTVIGANNYALLSDYYSPGKPQDQSLDDLIKTMENHFEPVSIIIAERFQLYKCDQKSGETIADFMAELRRLATNCKFGAHLDNALRDRFVCGLNNEAIQKRLLLEKDLTMSKAVDLSLSLQSADEMSQAMHPGKLSDGRVGVLKASSQQLCYHCCKKGMFPVIVNLNMLPVIHVTK